MLFRSLDAGAWTITMDECRISNFERYNPSGNFSPPNTFPLPICDGSATVESDVELGDMNPSHIIRECLTDTTWGMGYAVADMNDASFTAAADTLFSEGLGLSLIWDKQMPIEDFIKEILRHIDATLYVSRTTGLFTLKLIRADYNVGTLLALNESNIERVESFNRRGFDELYNSVTVKYVDSGTGRDASIEVQDIAQIQMQGALINTTMNYPGVTHGSLAARLAARDLRAMSTPLATCTIYASIVAADLIIGGVFKFSWSDYGETDVVLLASRTGTGRTILSASRHHKTCSQRRQHPTSPFCPANGQT